MIFDVLIDIIDYIFSIEIGQIPLHIALIGVSFMVGYCAAMFLVSFPISVWEHFSHKNFPKDTEDKITKLLTILFSVAMIMIVFYERSL